VGLDFSDCLISENEKKIGWLCTYTPEEIIHAAGFQPVRLSGKGNPIKRADACLHNNLCPFVRSVLDDAIDDSLGKFDGIIFANSCDAMRRLYDAWQTFIKADFTYILDPPKSIHSSSITYYADQLRGLVQSLEQHYGVTITNESLWKSIKIFNQTRTLIQNLSSLYKSNCPLSGEEMFTIMQMATRCDRVKFNHKLSAYIEQLPPEIPNRKESGQPRLLLAGCIIDQVNYIRLIEETGAQVVVNELCTGIRHFDTLVGENSDPFIALSSRYLNHAPCARMTDLNWRLNYLVQLAQDYRVDGVIYHILKFCDHYMWDMSFTTEEFEKIGLPLLPVESEYVKGSYGQLKTRFQAFVESLQS